MSTSLEQYLLAARRGESRELLAAAPAEMQVLRAHDPDTNHGMVGKFFLRRFGPFPIGHAHRGGRHHIDHITHVECGAMIVNKRHDDGRVEWFVAEAPNFIVIEASCLHNFIVVADKTSWYCIFAEKHLEELDSLPEQPFHLRRITKTAEVQKDK